MTIAQQITPEYSVRDELETVTLVDAEDNVIGPCGKIAAHENGQLHRAFSILITNPAGELLLQRRAACKYHFAGRWSNTCCGHPRPGEETLDAAPRRLREEFGFSVPLEEIEELQYRTVDPNSGLIEHEYLHVFQGHYAGTPCPNQDEVGEYRWMLPSRVLLSLSRFPDTFTPWFALLADTLISSDGIGTGRTPG
jgi:isopentenyl-diphosphate delta-isomerase